MLRESFATPFARLGEELDVAFRKAEHAEDAFAELAVEHLERARLHETFSLQEMARWALTSPDLPEQADPRADFGDPPVTIWRGRRFFISALVWRSSTTTIHQHAFTGAFQVLEGSSIQTRYAATERLAISEDLALVDLACTGIERLVKGDVRPIKAATTGIHSLFHLDHPSVSLVVRTQTDQRHPIQYRYDPPGLAVHDMRHESRQDAMRSIAAMLASTDSEAALEIISETIAQATSYDAYQILKTTLGATHLAYVERLIAHTRHRMRDEIAGAFTAALRETVRKRSIVSRRDAVREPTLRYLMAILLNAPSRSSAISLAHAYQPGRRGVDSLVAWVVELSRTTIRLQFGGRRGSQTYLGFRSLTHHPLQRFATRLMACRLSPPRTFRSIAQFEKVSRSPPFFVIDLCGGRKQADVRWRSSDSTKDGQEDA